jgi:hypothetical protein
MINVAFFRIEGGAFDGVMDAKTPFMYKVKKNLTLIRFLHCIEDFYFTVVVIRLKFSSKSVEQLTVNNSRRKKTEVRDL